MDMINPGQMREKVVFYELIKTSNGSGGSTSVQSEYLSTFAMVKPIKTRFDIEAGRPVLKQPHKVVIRYRRDKEPKIKMVMKWKGNTFLINDITDRDTERSLIELIVSTE